MASGIIKTWIVYLYEHSAMRYGMIGVLNTCVGLGIIFLLRGPVGLGDELANLIGYACGFSVSFTLNKIWTFRSTAHPVHALPRYLGVILVAYLANLGLVVLLIDHLGVDPYVSQTLGVVPFATIGYLGSRYLVFR